MKKINETAIIERIKALRTQHFGSRGKSKFARAIGISPSTYSYYENNRVPPIEILLTISEVTGADLQWLLTGQKKREIPYTAKENFTFASNQPLIGKLGELLTKDPVAAESVSAFIELLCEKKGIEKQLHPSVLSDATNQPGWIPVLGRTAAGMVHCWDQQLLPEPEQAVTELHQLVKKHIGRNILSSADRTLSLDLQAQALIAGLRNLKANLVQVSSDSPGQIVEFVECEELFKLFPDSFALHVDGSSMSPRINDGDLVIASPSVPAAQGHTAIAHIENQIGVTCKLIRTTGDGVHLIPINEKYETKIIPKEKLLWALAVLCHISV